MEGFSLSRIMLRFAYVALLKQDWPKVQGLRLKAIKSNWAKRKNVSLVGRPARGTAGRDANISLCHFSGSNISFRPNQRFMTYTIC
jgi:hypothetical protein